MSRFFAVTPQSRRPPTDRFNVGNLYSYSTDSYVSHTNTDKSDPRIDIASRDTFIPHRPKYPAPNPVELTPDSPSLFGRGSSFTYTPIYAEESKPRFRLRDWKDRLERREKKERRERRKSRKGRESSSKDGSDSRISEDSSIPWQGNIVESRSAERDRLSRFHFRRHHHQPPVEQEPPENPDSTYFGATQYEEPRNTHNDNNIRAGEEVLLKFIRSTLGTRAEGLTVRLMNKTPITTTTSFQYRLHQGSEDVDLDCISRDLCAGRLYRVGRKLEAGSWCNLLLGERFTVRGGKRQRHELTYVRESCTCIRCRIREAEVLREQANVEISEGSGDSSTAAELHSVSSVTSRTPVHSAMANFVTNFALPSTADLSAIGGVSSWRELEIGTIVRLHSRAAAKLKFTDDARQLFGHLAYTGPISHEEIYRKVTTIGVNYYSYNKGKRERKVYIQGELVSLPVQVGVVKLGTQPMYMNDIGATFVLYRQQKISIYVGEIVLEGNSIGSYVDLLYHVQTLCTASGRLRPKAFCAVM